VFVWHKLIFDTFYLITPSLVFPSLSKNQEKREINLIFLGVTYGVSTARCLWIDGNYNTPSLFDNLDYDF